MDHVDWQAIIEFVGLVIAGITSHSILRAKVATLEETHKETKIDLSSVRADLKEQTSKLDQKQEILEAKLFDKLSEIQRDLAKIQGRLSISDDNRGS